MEELWRSLAPGEDSFSFEIIAYYSKNLKQGTPSPACNVRIEMRGIRKRKALGAATRRECAVTSF